MRSRSRSGSGLDAAVVEDARGRVEPERLRIQELLAEAEAAERGAAAELDAAVGQRAEAERLAAGVREREEALESEIAAVRASAAGERERAAAEAQRDLAAAREELRGLREEINAARRREREARRAAPAAAVRAERDRDRRLGAASTRAAKAEQALRALDQPLPLTGPLAAGDPVEAPGLGVHGTIAAIEGDEAEVVGPAGHRLRLPLAQLRPSARREREEAETPVRVVAAARSDVSDELDVRGQRAQDAREAVRSFVDDAALAGLADSPCRPRPRHRSRARRGPRRARRPSARRPQRERLGGRRHGRASRRLAASTTFAAYSWYGSSSRTRSRGSGTSKKRSSASGASQSRSGRSASVRPTAVRSPPSATCSTLSRQGPRTRAASAAAASIRSRSCSSRRRRNLFADEPPFLWRPLTKRVPTFEATSCSPSKTPSA